MSQRPIRPDPDPISFGYQISGLFLMNPRIAKISGEILILVSRGTNLKMTVEARTP